MTWNKVVGFQKDSFVDWPGRIVPVIFFQGCNLRCPTCHNKHIAYSKNEIISYPKVDILRDLRAKSTLWYDGIVLSGGEVTVVPGVIDWISKLREQFKLPIKIDSNGINLKTIKELISLKLVDLIAVDVKGPWHLYPKLTNTSFRVNQVEETFKEIFQLAVQYPQLFYFRTTKVPLLTDNDIDSVKSILPANHELHIQDYIPN